MDNSIDPRFFNRVAQIAHFFTMYAITFTTGAFARSLTWSLVALGICTAYAGFHEFVWDPREENAATRGSDLEDFLFLMAGAIAGFLLSFLVH